MMSEDDLDHSQKSSLVWLRDMFKGTEGACPGMHMNDSTYIRYLRARNWNTEKALKMLNATIAWRHDFGLQYLHTDWKKTIEYENATGKLYCRGFDRKGHAILYLKPAYENSKNHEGNLKHLVYNLERAIAIMEATTGQTKVVLLIDYDGFAMTKSPPISTSKAVLHILQDHYPERLHRAFVVRPLYLFYGLFQVLSPFMDAVTRSKIVMLTNAQLSAKDNQMLSDISCDQLEFAISGDRKEADHRPFDSKMYLAGDFNKDFLQVLTEAEDEEKEHMAQAQSVPPADIEDNTEPPPAAVETTKDKSDETTEDKPEEPVETEDKQ